MAIITVQVTNDGFAYMENEATYAAARDGVGEGSSTGALYVGQQRSPDNGGWYNTVYRTFLSIVIPEMDSISAASLFLYGAVDTTVDFDVYIHMANYVPPISADDFIAFVGRRIGQAHNGIVLNDAWDTTSFVIGWNEITLNAAGKAAVLAAQGGTLKLVLISKEDFDNTAPVTTDRAIFESTVTGGKEPYLSMTYSPLTLSVNVHDCSNLKEKLS